MRATATYALVSLALVGGVTAALWPFLGPGGRVGVLVAGAVAVPVQVAAFGVLARHRIGERAFFSAWVGGTVVRLGLVVTVAGAIAWWRFVPPAPTLLALAGFFFGLLLLEPVWLRRAPGPDDDRVRDANGDDDPGS